jgi:hypothetical protein
VTRTASGWDARDHARYHAFGRPHGFHFHTGYAIKLQSERAEAQTSPRYGRPCLLSPSAERCGGSLRDFEVVFDAAATGAHGSRDLAIDPDWYSTPKNHDP